MELFTAFKNRRSIRAYTDQPVSRKDIEEILGYAGLAPSAINVQPWEYVVTYGEEKERLCRCLKRAHSEKQVSCGPGTKAALPAQFTNRSRAAAAVMAPKVKALNVDFNRFVEEGSCSFYGAPIAIVVTIDRRFPELRYLDLGLSVAYLLLAAEAKFLGTCPIGLITAYDDAMADCLNISHDKKIVLAIALGYADESSPINQFRTERDDLENILSWYE
jgi:nitroreductase